MLQSDKCLVQKELGCLKAAGLQTGTGRASSANSPALGWGKGRRRINHSPQPTLWKPHTLLRGSRHADKGWRGARNDLSPAQEQPLLQEVLGPTCTISPSLHGPAPVALGRGPLVPGEPLGHAGPQTVPWAGGSVLVGSRPNQARNGSKNWMSELPFVGTFPIPASCSQAAWPGAGRAAVLGEPCGHTGGGSKPQPHCDRSHEGWRGCVPCVPAQHGRGPVWCEWEICPVGLGASRSREPCPTAFPR